VLEVGDNAYTLRFGGERVTRSDVLHVTVGNRQATFVGDLSSAEHVPSDAFDCVVLTQTLHLIYDPRAALATIHRIPRPGGVLLATFPGISQIDRGEWGGTWYWGFTGASARRLFAERFTEAGVELETHGNVLAATGFLHGLAAEELTRAELDAHDPHYQVIIAARATKPG
jgi:SAM-dependent methyltransferase